MKAQHATRWVWAAPATLYLLFLWWYGGRGEPMGKAEVEQRLAAISASASPGSRNTDPASGNIIEELRRLAENDDGNEFLMLNLIRFRPRALYPAGSGQGDDALAADARYSAALAPHLIRHGGIPVFLGTPQGRFIDVAGDPQWQRIAIVRYRSRRDMFNMVADIAPLDVAIHKWASIEKTQVFPVGSDFSLIVVRASVALLLLALALPLHWLLRRRQVNKMESSA